ncbi:MAG: immunoglobulin domain-containing protein, partial [Verrucomicrobiota bacterium]|nr:immunoglobulin domain-containing protein [Verrucomicrobiota bacterium]
GTTANKFSPVRIGSANNWKTACAGYYHTLALRTDGTLWAWGDNSRGQLGTGTAASALTPVSTGQSAAWRAVAAGAYHTVAVRNDGTLWAWGNNNSGQLGDGLAWRATPGKIGAPVVLEHPLSLTTAVGGTATFYVSYSGSQPISCQWRKNGIPLSDSSRISGVTSATLTIHNVQPADQGAYTVVLANPYDSATSETATLSVVGVPTEPFILEPIRLPGGQFQFTVASAPGKQIELQASTDLANWQTIASFVNPSGTMSYSVPATNPHYCFYRLRQLP